MKEVLFITHTKMPLEVITTFGVSVKFGTNPIGKFGTGLKYAIAVLLREGHEVQATINNQSYDFLTREADIRGQAFEVCQMRAEGGETIDLPFTTDLGKHWELWMAFRELYSNTKDEGGNASDTPLPMMVNLPDSTIITVRGEDFHDIYLRKDEFFLEEPATEEETFDDLEIRSGETSFVYNRNIRVAEFDYPLMHTYNVPSPINLTEDRTIRHSSEIDNRILANTTRSTNREFIRKILMAPERNHESRLDFTYYMEYASITFKDIVEELMSDDSTKEFVNASVAKWYRQAKEKERKRQSIGKRTFKVSLALPKEVTNESIINTIIRALDYMDDTSEIEVQAEEGVA